MSTICSHKPVHCLIITSAKLKIGKADITKTNSREKIFKMNKDWDEERAIQES